MFIFINQRVKGTATAASHFLQLQRKFLCKRNVKIAHRSPSDIVSVSEYRSLGWLWTLLCDYYDEELPTMKVKVCVYTRAVLSRPLAITAFALSPLPSPLSFLFFFYCTCVIAHCTGASSIPEVVTGSRHRLVRYTSRTYATHSLFLSCWLLSPSLDSSAPTLSITLHQLLYPYHHYVRSLIGSLKRGMGR